MHDHLPVDSSGHYIGAPIPPRYQRPDFSAKNMICHENWLASSFADEKRLDRRYASLHHTLRLRRPHHKSLTINKVTF